MGVGKWKPNWPSGKLQGRADLHEGYYTRVRAHIRGYVVTPHNTGPRGGPLALMGGWAPSTPIVTGTVGGSLLLLGRGCGGVTPTHDWVWAPSLGPRGPDEHYYILVGLGPLPFGGGRGP